MRIGSLFSGIGGLELGLEAALGAETLWQCEADPYARAVLERHWPDAERYDDVKTMVRPPYVDLICGGFPCQDISNAGKRKGIHGEKSRLWFEFARIIGEVQPKYVVIENVAALASRGLNIVLGDLACFGYDAEWSVVSAESVGAPHRRNRLFVLAWRSDANGQRFQERPQLDSQPECGGEACQPRGYTGGLCDEVADANLQGLEERQGVRGNDGAKLATAFRSGWWSAEPAIRRVVDGLLSRLDRRKRVARLRCLGNAVVPQVSYRVGLRLKELTN